MKEISPIFLKKIKLFLFPVAIIFLVLVLTGRFLLPKIEETKAVFEKNSKDKETLTTLETKVKKLNELKNSGLTADFQQAEVFLPSDKNVPQIFASINQLEKTNGVQIEDFSIKPGILSKEGTPSARKAGENVENLTFNITLLGSESYVLQFTENILKTAPLFNITSVDLTALGGVSRLILGVSTYYQNLPDSLGKVDSPLPEFSQAQKKALALIQGFSLSTMPIDLGITESSPSGGVINKSIFEL